MLPSSFGLFPHFVQAFFYVFIPVRQRDISLRPAQSERFRRKSLSVFVLTSVAVLFVPTSVDCFRFGFVCIDFFSTLLVLLSFRLRPDISLCPPTTVIYSLIYADQRPSDFDWSGNQPFRRRDASIQPFCRNCFFNGCDASDDDADSSVPSLMGALPSGSVVVAPFNVTEYTNSFVQIFGR